MLSGVVLPTRYGYGPTEEKSFVVHFTVKLSLVVNMIRGSLALPRRQLRGSNAKPNQKNTMATVNGRELAAIRLSDGLDCAIYYIIIIRMQRNNDSISYILYTTRTYYLRWL